MNSVKLTLAAAMTTPPSAGPARKLVQYIVLASALPSRSRPAAEVTLTVAARPRDRAVTAIRPSATVSTRTGTSEKLDAINPSPTNSTASIAYRIPRLRRADNRSIRATSIGENNAGANCEQRK